MKHFKSSTICKLSKSNALKNNLKFSRKGKKYNVVYSSTLDKWYLNSADEKGVFVTIGEIN